MFDKLYELVGIRKAIEIMRKQDLSNTLKIRKVTDKKITKI